MAISMRMPTSISSQFADAFKISAQLREDFLNAIESGEQSLISLNSTAFATRDKESLLVPYYFMLFALGQSRDSSEQFKYHGAYADGLQRIALFLSDEEYAAAISDPVLRILLECIASKTGASGDIEMSKAAVADYLNNNAAYFLSVLIGQFYKAFKRFARRPRSIKDQNSEEQTEIITTLAAFSLVLSSVKTRRFRILIEEWLGNDALRHNGSPVGAGFDATSPYVEQIENAYLTILDAARREVKLSGSFNLGDAPALFESPQPTMNPNLDSNKRDTNKSSAPTGGPKPERVRAASNSDRRTKDAREDTDEHIIGSSRIEETEIDSLDDLIKKSRAIPIPITEQHAVYADPVDGRILGPIGEGTSAVVFYSRSRLQPLKGSDHLGYAIRVPKLSTGNIFQNFENAETCYFEHTQAGAIRSQDALSTPVDLGCINRVVSVDSADALKIDDKSWTASDARNILIGLHMAPGMPARIGVVSERGSWPSALRTALQAFGSSDAERYERLTHLLTKSREVHQANVGHSTVQSGSKMPPMYIFHDPRDVTKRSGKKSVVEELPIQLDRESVQSVFAMERASGWTFGVPFMICDWLISDLHRLLAGLVSQSVITDKKDGLLSNLRAAPLHVWFSLAVRLCEGLRAIHGADGLAIHRVHGDVRPANVMFSGQRSPKECKWIDIGLGSIAARERRLWQSRRTSVFYSWERTAHESEENDQIELVTDELGGKREFRIRFLFRDNNLQKAVPVKLKAQIGGAAGKLALLNAGDRLVIGSEYIFEVDRVDEEFVYVSRVWEVAAGQIPLEANVAKVFAGREHKTVSEFKILWQWGAASDIYSLGVILLYIFYMRGRYGALARSSEEFGGDVEEGFASIVSAMKTDGFLAGFIRSLDIDSEREGSKDGQKTVHFRNKEQVFGLDAEVYRIVRDEAHNATSREKREQVEKFIEIVDQLGVFAPGLQYVFYGVNSSPAIFTSLIYIALQCIWRQDEIDRIDLTSMGASGLVKFSPYCRTRVAESTKSDIVGGVIDDLEVLISHLAAKHDATALCNDSVPVVQSGGSSAGFGRNIHGRLVAVMKDNRDAAEIAAEVVQLMAGRRLESPNVTSRIQMLFGASDSEAVTREVMSKIEDLLHVLRGEAVARASAVTQPAGPSEDAAPPPV